MSVIRFHLHLVSDATGDTVHSVARACLVQFEEAEAIEHIWSMVRTKTQMERVLASIEANRGVVLFTLVDETLRSVLQDGCRKLQVPSIPVLESAQQSTLHCMNPKLLISELSVHWAKTL